MEFSNVDPKHFSNGIYENIMSRKPNHLDYYTILLLSHQAAWADPLSIGDVWQGRVKTV